MYIYSEVTSLVNLCFMKTTEWHSEAGHSNSFFTTVLKQFILNKAVFYCFCLFFKIYYKFDTLSETVGGQKGDPEFNPLVIFRMRKIHSRSFKENSFDIE